jgi:hypothetical protein
VGEYVRNYIHYHTSSIRDACLYMFVFLYFHSNINKLTTAYNARLITNNHYMHLLRVVRIRAALLTRTGSESEMESDTGDVSLGAGSTRMVETRGEDPSLS